MRATRLFLVHTVTFAALTLVGLALPIVSAQESESNSSKPPEVVDLVELVQSQPDFLAPAKRDVFKTIQTFDINRDGTDDLAWQMSSSRGPLSTYFSNYRLLALGECKILKGGLPLEHGTSITVVDLLNHTDQATLCSLGASLRLIDDPASTFSGGPWWKVDSKALSLLVYENEQPQVGYVMMSVSENGSVKFGAFKFVAADDELVTVDED